MKSVASTLTTILEHPQMEVILDRKAEIRPVAHQVVASWDVDLFTRKPGPAYTEDGVFTGTDLDLACLLHALVNRGAVINLPTYQNRRASVQSKDQVVISRSNRHGRMLGLTSNQRAFSFSVLINDANVITTDSVGAPRNFMVVDLDGTWYDGWKSIQFVPTAKENDFLNDRKLWTDGDTVHFKNFVHPNRWVSFYGSPYFMTKTLIDRLKQEVKHLGQEVKRLLEEGVRFPSSGEESTVSYQSEMVGEVEDFTFTAFEAETDAPIHGEFEYYPSTTEGLLAAKEKRHELLYRILPRIRFATRATELAFYQQAASKDPKNPQMASWIKDATWENGYRVTPRSRTDWNRLVVAQPRDQKSGQMMQGLALRWRTYSRTEQVAGGEY